MEPFRFPAPQWSARSVGAQALLALIAATFLLPKLLLVDFYRGLWVNLSATQLAGVLLQDLGVALAVLAVLQALLRSAPPARFLVLALLSSSLLTLLFLDVRVREIWLQPITGQLIGYAWRERSDLGSGLPLFFQRNAGWGMTFRRILAIVLGGHLALWAALAIASRRTPPPDADPAPIVPRLPAALTLAALVALLLAIAFGRDQRYHLQDNILTRHVVDLAVSDAVAGEDAKAAAQFDQKPVPASAVLATPRGILPDARPFRNLVLVFLESVRWKDFAREERDQHLPVLDRIAREGLVVRCAVPVPHSSKGYFSVLSGRYPYPGVEIREAETSERASPLGELRRMLGVRTSAFASLNLDFENTRGMLRSLGVEHAFQVQDLARLRGIDARRLSSFGHEDDQLYALGAGRLRAEGVPFAAVFLPVSAHYPYDYPGKPDGEGATHDAYLRALSSTDRLLADLLARLSVEGLAEDTLVVLVGDHGESFGERGVWTHNSSLHAEEVTVPLLFWSADGRLAHPGVLEGRQIDVAPTILDLMGATRTDVPVQGVSLLRVGRLPAAYFSTFYDDLALGMLEGSSKYILEVPSNHLLHYDLSTDPEERSPLPLDAAERDTVVARLRAFQAFQRLAHPAARR